MHPARTAHSESFPGYRLLEPLGRGGFGEVWKCEAPGGLLKAIKFVFGSDDVHNSGTGLELELRALQHIRSIRHPFLLSIERAELVGGELVIVMELADQSLHDLLEAERRAGRPGVARDRLLTYLGEAAEALDLLNLEHGLKHLDVKPRNLFLMGGHVKVGDFGLVSSLADLYGSRSGARPGITPLYAAPETFLSQVTLYSDQYSLAVTYHELLTGTLPFAARNARQLAVQHLQGEPDLGRLPEPDRPILARALARDPRQRFASCTEFIEALRGGPGGEVLRPRSTSFDLGEMSSTAFLSRSQAHTAAPQQAGQPATQEGGSVLPGYRFLECLGRMPTSEIWKAEGPDGQVRLVRLLTLVENGPGPDPIARLSALRHPGLADLQIVPAGPGRLALVSDPGDGTLGTRLKECRAQRLPGIPRAELLGYLRLVAAALDDLAERSQLLHLGLTPRHLLLQRGRVRLLDFGLAELFWVPAGLQPAELNPRYAALELFEGSVCDSSDQYSLALIFVELLTGLHPFRNLNGRQMASPRLRGQPDLSLLPGADRPVVLRALSATLEQRYPTCSDFIAALEGEEKAPAEAPAATPEWQAALQELVHAAGRPHQLRQRSGVHFLHRADDRLEHRCRALLVPGTARLKLKAFAQQWHAEALSRSADRFVYEVRTPGSFWQRCLGRAPGVQIDIRLLKAEEDQSTLTPLHVVVSPIDCGKGKAGQVLEAVGPALLVSLQHYLQTQSERQDQERFPLVQEVLVCTCGLGRPGAPIPARTRDIGRTGACLLLPAAPPIGLVSLRLHRWASSQPFEVHARVHSVEPADEGGVAVEVRW
jgi:serine/threonine protein kinase